MNNFLSNILKKDKPEITLPPSELTYIGQGDFIKIGQEFLEHFIEIVKIKPTDKILDVGCGIGRMAIPLTKYLNRKGSYAGFDIVKYAIDWCSQNISSKYPNFSFNYSDVMNKNYNPDGRYNAQEYVFPYKDNTFDFVFLISVFTHTLKNELEQYLSEISRVLKKDGKCFITYFLLNDESRTAIDESNSRMDFKPFSDMIYTTNFDVPEEAIAFDERYILDTYKKNSLSVEPIYYGNWCNRKQFTTFQDIVVATKSS